MNWKKYLILFALVAFLASGCGKVVLKQETPSSPKESYQELPK